MKKISISAIFLPSLFIINCLVSCQSLDDYSIRYDSQRSEQPQVVTIQGQKLQQQQSAVLESGEENYPPGFNAQPHRRYPESYESNQAVTVLPIIHQRLCVPSLDFSSFINESLSFGGKPKNESRVNFSFVVGDIDLPVGAKDGTVHSAAKLLSSISSQLDEETDQEQEEVENVVKFRENRLNLEGINLTMLNVHLYSKEEPRFSVGLSIKNTSLTGKFHYNGPVLLTGYYRMSIDNVYLVASSNLTKTFKSGVNEMNNDDLSIAGQQSKSVLKTNELKMNISNLGYITIEIFDSKEGRKATKNYLLRMLQRFLQHTIKRTYFTFESHIRKALEKEGRQALDCELTRFTPLLEQNLSVNSSDLSRKNHQVDLMKIINNEIAKLQLNTVSLPSFEHQQTILGTTAIVHFYNGSLSGLDHMKLTGDTRIKLQDQHLFVNTSIGWSNIRPYYNWNLLVGGGSNKSSLTKGFVAFNIKEIDFDAVITRGLTPHTRIRVDELIIRQLESPKMELSGLPGMNRITKGLVNFFMGRLKQRLTNSIQPTLQKELERSLNRFRF